MNANRPCPAEFASEFLRPPQYEKLASGTRLYKFVNIPVNRLVYLRSPWWIGEREFDRLRAEMNAREARLSDVARTRLAIAERWNPGMDGLCTITVAGEIDAWRGTAKSQWRHGPQLVGGGEQVCVPGLTWRHIALERTQVPFSQTGVRQ